MSLNLIPAVHISSSGLDAERGRMEITANNLANVRTTNGPDGKAYKKRIPVFSSVFQDAKNSRPGSELAGVELSRVELDERPARKTYMPGHPDADKKGFVEMPNISPIEEMLDMITATRAYEANLSVMKQCRDMAEKTITMGRA